MSEKKLNENKSKSWVNQLLVNNQILMPLVTIVLCLLIVLLFTKVSHLFEPIMQFVGIVGLPIIISGLLFYIFNPVVDFMEKKGIKRNFSIMLLYVIVIGLIVWGVIILVPKIEHQTKSFIEDWPVYWQTIEQKTGEFFNAPLFEKFSEPIENAINELFSSINQIAKSISKNAFTGIGSVVGAVANIVVTIVTVPFILFYLLKDGKELTPYVTQFLPTKIRHKTIVVLKDINKQLSSYVRGQVTVAIAVAIMFMIGFSVIGLKYSITLGVLAGFLNLIPYVGSALATIPAVILALVDGPKMLIAVIIVFVLEQTIEGKFISPLVLGSQLDIHPITIIFVLLSAGKIFGFMGVIIGIPVYATIKVIVTHLFTWYKEKSGLYEEDLIEKG
ncbi:AI-2E family transporter [Vagococcus sp. DIV0080]|uniref:AI-2E family transporter n=1 Tax=Candidatus Vagococcus giribetii TaxID=2230876 RepID=A0ABS3HX28_9ENTE|nr:AI-2E family transporter [Vagococcus sp. DIV0080]MBO0477693.1 AI-2E family transporter [Vagococcus sp. DIV0080]